MSTTLPPISPAEPAEPAAREIAPTIHRFTVEEYFALAQIGVVYADDRLELIEGVIVEKMTQNPPHTACLTRLDRLLHQLVDPSRWVVRIQMVLSLPDSAPEPDALLAIGPESRHDQRHPTPADAPLVIEVSDDSIGHDRRTRGRMYARAGVRNYWIVNLLERQIEHRFDPIGGANEARFTGRKVFTEAEVISLQLDEQTTLAFKVADVLPSVPAGH